MDTKPLEIPGLQKKHLLAAVLVLLAVIALVYFYGRGTPYYSGTETGDGDVGRLLEQGNSDEVSAIERDLGSTNLTDLDRELTDIGVQLR